MRCGRVSAVVWQNDRFNLWLCVKTTVSYTQATIKTGLVLWQIMRRRLKHPFFISPQQSCTGTWGKTCFLHAWGTNMRDNIKNFSALFPCLNFNSFTEIMQQQSLRTSLKSYGSTNVFWGINITIATLILKQLNSIPESAWFVARVQLHRHVCTHRKAQWQKTDWLRLPELFTSYKGNTAQVKRVITLFQRLQSTSSQKMKHDVTFSGQHVIEIHWIMAMCCQGYSCLSY